MHSKQNILKLTVMCVIVSFSVFPLTLAADQTAPLPTRSLGDQWKFLVDYKGQEGTLFNLTATVTSMSMQNPSGGIECFEITSVGSGIVYGANVSGTADYLFKEYFSVDDFNQAEMSSNSTVNTVRSGVCSRMSQVTDVTFNPPYGLNMGFPLSVGKTWTSNRTATAIVTTDIDGAITNQNSTTDQSTTFVVDRTETVTTTAGTFETYVLVGTSTDGSKMEIYYAPAASIQAKEVDYDASGNVIATMELTGYQIAGDSTMDALSMYWILAVALAVAFAIGAVGLLAIRQRKTTKKAPVQS